MPVVNRNFLPGHKQGGSVSRHSIDQLAPFIAQLYHSPALLRWLGTLTGERLQLSPADDPHAYALYFYSRPGDHIGWHYDTSYYSGRRYTLLLGVVDRSTCRLDYELHTKEPGGATQSGSLQIAPGGLVFFDGDKLRHRITPDRRQRVPGVADVRIRHQPAHESVVALRVQHEGRHRLFRVPPGVQPPASGTRAHAMRRLGSWLLTAGLLLFLALLVSQGLPAILSTLAAAGWGLLAVAAFHLIPADHRCRWRSACCISAARPSMG